jgi:hypothetical protein
VQISSHLPTTHVISDAPQTESTVAAKAPTTNSEPTSSTSSSLTSIVPEGGLHPIAARSDGGGATVGRANFDVFTCTKGIDTATAG